MLISITEYLKSSGRATRAGRTVAGKPRDAALRQRPVRTFVAWTITPLVVILFAFPNYCDRCSYRDVARAFAQKTQRTFMPPCCAKKAQAGDPPKKGDRPDESNRGTHVRFSYCLSKTLSSIAEHRDILKEIRLAITETHYHPDERNAVRLAILLDHKDCRGPPA